MDYERTDKNPQPLEPNAYIEATISKKESSNLLSKLIKRDSRKSFRTINNRKTTSDN